MYAITQLFARRAVELMWTIFPFQKKTIISAVGALNSAINFMLCIGTASFPHLLLNLKSRKMESVFHYHTLAEAQEIRQTYSSWIGKKAHTGMGQQELLRDITLKPGNTVSVGEKPEQAYYLEFIFENKVLNVYEFTVGNGLMPITGTLSFAELQQHVKSAWNASSCRENLFPI